MMHPNIQEHTEMIPILAHARTTFIMASEVPYERQARSHDNHPRDLTCCLESLPEQVAKLD